MVLFVRKSSEKKKKSDGEREKPVLQTLNCDNEVAAAPRTEAAEEFEQSWQEAARRSTPSFAIIIISISIAATNSEFQSEQHEKGRLNQRVEAMLGVATAVPLRG